MRLELQQLKAQTSTQAQQLQQLQAQLQNSLTRQQETQDSLNGTASQLSICQQQVQVR